MALRLKCKNKQTMVVWATHRVKCPIGQAKGRLMQKITSACLLYIRNKNAYLCPPNQ